MVMKKYKNAMHSYDYCQYSKTALLPKSLNHAIANNTKMCKDFLTQERIDNRLGYDNSGSNKDDIAVLRTRAANCIVSHTELRHTSFVSTTEKDFPIAFQLLVHYKQGRTEQYLRLLKQLYRPHNTYCIHIDKNSPVWWTNMMHNFAACFDNIFIASDLIRIRYGTASILHAHLSCLKDLERSKRPWNYVITLHATEVPLVTNREIVDELIKINGSNFITKGVNAADKSFPHKWLTYRSRWNGILQTYFWSRLKLGPVPYNMTVYKSAASIESAMTRDFVKFILTDKRGQKFIKYLEDVKSGEEFYFSTMNQLPDAPGGTHTLKHHKPHALQVAYAEWKHLKTEGICIDQYFVHSVCIANYKDLPRLREASENMKWWFYNKYLYEYDTIVMDCMEMLLLERRLKEYDRDCTA